MFKPLLRNMSGLVRPLIWQADLDCQGSGLRGRAKTVPHRGGGWVGVVQQFFANKIGLS